MNKSNKNSKLEEIQTNDSKQVNNLAILNYMENIEKNITGDGNCFYRCISYYFLESEDFHLDYRNLLYEYMEKNKELFLDFFQDTNPDIKLSKKERLEILKLYSFFKIPAQSFGILILTILLVNISNYVS